MRGGGGTGKTTAAITYVAATRDELEYPGGVVWLCGESYRALELSMQQVYDQHLSAPSEPSVRGPEACDALLKWLAHGRSGRWLVIVDNVDPIELVLPHFMNKLPPSAVGDVLVTTRASDARVLAAFPSTVCVQQGCLDTCDAAVAVWRLVCAYNAQHETHCGWQRMHAPVDSCRGAPDSPPRQVPPGVAQELQQLWLEAKSEYTALLSLAKDSDHGFCGLPLALVTGTGALCIRDLSFSLFLAACEEQMLGRVINASENVVFGSSQPSTCEFLQLHGLSCERAAAIVALLAGDGPVTLGGISELSGGDIDRVASGELERDKLQKAVKAAKKLGAMADDTVTSRLQTRRRLAGIWTLSRAGLSPAAQELMDIIAYFPPDCTMEEVLVWGSLPTASHIARVFSDAESAVPSHCKCRGCCAQRRRKVVASLAQTLVGASLVKRRPALGRTVFPRQCLASGDGGGTFATDTAYSEGEREYCCLSVHRVVQEVVRAGHGNGRRPGAQPVELAWRASLTCWDDPNKVDASKECGSQSVPSVAVRQMIAARHAAETVPHVKLEDAIRVFAVAEGDASNGAPPLRALGWVVSLLRTASSAVGLGRSITELPSRFRLLRRVCEYANLLGNCCELGAAASICHWVGTDAPRGSGLWHSCVVETQLEVAGATVYRCARQLGLVYNRCSVYAAAGAMNATALAMAQRIHGSKDHSDVAASRCSLAQVYEAQGRLDDSASLHEESLAMDRRIHGSKDHSSVAVSLCSLAQVYRAQGRLDDSASLGEESLAMKRRTHGSKDHSDVAASLRSLAQVYRAQGRLDGSASLGEESLAMKRRIHGSKDHSDAATVLAAH